MRKSPTRWSSIAYCATKVGLLLRIKWHLQGNWPRILPLDTLLSRRHVDLDAWADIEALPAIYPRDAETGAQIPLPA